MFTEKELKERRHRVMKKFQLRRLNKKKNVEKAYKNMNAKAVARWKIIRFCLRNTERTTVKRLAVIIQPFFSSFIPFNHLFKKPELNWPLEPTHRHRFSNENLSRKCMYIL